MVHVLVWWLACGLAGSLALSLAVSVAAADPRERFEGRMYVAADGSQLPYRLLVPRDYDAGQKYPLVLFLHGAGERGSDNQKQLVHGMADFASDEIMRRYPSFVIAPQCPDEQQWVNVPWSADAHVAPPQPSRPLANALALVAALQREFSIDPQRIYITGLSMGGYGVWDAVTRQPERFAAAAPICGGGDPAAAARAKGVPIWAFHGDQDEAVKVGRSREMIAALTAAGATPKYTEYAGVGHDSWSRTYADPAFYQWLFAQRRES